MTASGSEVTRTAVVIGGAGGIGEACAHVLARDGFHVLIADVVDAGPVVRDIASRGWLASYCRFDLADATTHLDLLDCLEDLPPLRAVVISAALLGPMVPLREYTRDDWDRVVGVNLTGTFFAAQTLGNHMAECGGGRLILFMSGAGRRPAKTTIIPYIATKAAIPLLVNSFAHAFKGTGVLFAAVDPGRTLTAINKAAYPDPADAVTPEMPLGRTLEPEETAEVVAFLCSSRADGVTGNTWGVSTVL